MLDEGDSIDAMSEALSVVLSADTQLFNDFINKSRRPIPPSTLALLRDMLQGGHVRFAEVKQR